MTPMIAKPGAAAVAGTDPTLVVAVTGRTSR